MAKNSFIIYYGYQEALEDLTDEQVGKLFRALINYDRDRIEPKFTGVLNVAFKFIKTDLDANLDKYENICERNKQNGKLGGRPKNPENPVGFSETQKSERFLEKTQKPKKADNDNEYDNEYDIYKEEVYKKNLPNSSTHSSDLENSSFQSKEVKHKYGEYDHVLLTDTELSKLNENYGEEETNKAVKYLDEYIEMKGAKYKSHYLALRKWVFEALKRNKQINSRNYNKKELNGLYDDLDNIQI